MAGTGLITKAEHDAIVAQHTDRIEYLKHQVEKLKHMLWGRRSEKQVIPPGAPFQSELFTEAEYEVEKPREDEPPARRRKRRKSKPRFSEDVQREIKDIELAEHDRQCEACGKVMEDIGYESSERAHVVPAQVVVHETRRHKYACGCKAGGVRLAPTKATAFPKARVTDEARAHFLVQKFVDHCPYYRQSAILSRSGVEISDRTLCHYGIEAADRLAPIVVAMRDELLACAALQADETTLPVLKTEKAKPGAHRGYLWAYADARGSIVFDYCRTRSGDHPRGFLDGYRGILQTDRYEGYEGIRRRDGIIDVACWAHARRRFLEASKVSPRRTKPVLDLVQKLYGVEKRAREAQLAPADRARLRREHSLPVLRELKALLDEMVVTVRPSTPLGVVVGYALNHWRAFIEYVNHGEVEIDSNLIENSIRPIALGRKNYLFAGSELGAEAAAIVYSLTETCRRLRISPQDYLVDVFRRLAVLDPTNPEEIRALTPARWKAARQANASS
ncbi:MAG: IS66 family transposase [Planctomycetota bacterium]